MRMRTMTIAALLALTTTAGAQTLDYGLLCGATEGSSNNDDFCRLWQQGNYQGMRNALSVAIRTGRAAENRNRYYFDHRRGADRGLFIQLKRPWMDESWRIVQDWGYDTFARIVEVEIVIFNLERGINIEIDFGKRKDFQKGVMLGAIINDRGNYIGYTSIGIVAADKLARVTLDSGQDTVEQDLILTWSSSKGRILEWGGPSDAYAADYVKRIVECKIEEVGYTLGDTQIRPDCDRITE